jgi:hypothetical protein
MMGYIKKFNEASSDSILRQEVQDFCETHLAYLMDEGLKVSVIESLKVTLSFRLVVNKTFIELKDHIIPFLTHLRNSYDLVSLGHRPGYSPNIEFTLVGGSEGRPYPDWIDVEDVISDKIVPVGRLRDDYKVNAIQFYVVRKKK